MAGHSGLQTDAVLGKKPGVLHLGAQAAGSELCSTLGIA